MFLCKTFPWMWCGLTGLLLMKRCGGSDNEWFLRLTNQTCGFLNFSDDFVGELAALSWGQASSPVERNPRGKRSPGQRPRSPPTATCWSPVLQVAVSTLGNLWKTVKNLEGRTRLCVYASVSHVTPKPKSLAVTMQNTCSIFALWTPRSPCSDSSF